MSNTRDKKKNMEQFLVFSQEKTILSLEFSSKPNCKWEQDKGIFKASGTLVVFMHPFWLDSWQLRMKFGKEFLKVSRNGDANEEPLQKVKHDGCASLKSFWSKLKKSQNS